MENPAGGEPLTTGVAIIGAGFGGIGAAAELMRRGIDDFVMLERREDVGGVWLDNTYPGCRCDIPSVLYSFSFAPRPDWSDRFATRDEIWAYLRDCAADLGLGPKLRFGTDVLDARWDNEAAHWRIETATAAGTQLVLARMLIVATGALNEPAIPTIADIDSFRGEAFHSSTWPADFDPTGKRVAVIGTGATAVQLVPEIAEQCEQLTVYQRTPSWVLPRGDRPVPEFAKELFRRMPWTERALRSAEFLRREAMTGSFVESGRFLNLIEKLGRKQLHDHVADPTLRATLTPNYRPGCKRILMSDDWYPAVSRPNVRVIADPIVRADQDGLITQGADADPIHAPFDAIIFATGFLVTKLPFPSRITGRTGATLADVWGRRRVSAYLGSTVPEFPNMIIITGPNTGLGNNSMVLMIESQARYAADFAGYVSAGSDVALEVRPEVAQRFTDYLDRRLSKSVWVTGGCASWYQDEDGRVSTLWPGRTRQFNHLTKSVNLADYRQVPSDPSPATPGA